MNSHDLNLLTSALRSVLACMSNDNSRYAIAGVFVEANLDGLRLVATDGHRMAIARAPGVVFAGLTRTILPTAAVKAMTGRAKALALDIQITDTGSTVKTVNGVLQFEAVAGNFPPYKDVIPGQVAPGVVVPPVSPALMASTTAWSASSGFKVFATRHRPGSPVLVLDPGNHDWLAVVMPINVHKAGLWTEEDAQCLTQLTGKTLRVLETDPAEAPTVAGAVGVVGRQAA